jgi:hypothetical protein
MAAYFSIRLVLSRPSATLREKLNALSELSRMPNWAKVECLPGVTFLVRQGSSQIAGAADDAVFEPLLRGMPAHRRHGFRNAIKGLRSSDLAMALQNLNLATKFAASETTSSVENLGVFSIDHNLDATIGLTLLSVLASEDATQTREFLDQRALSRGDQNYIAEILDRALSHAFGRHQCMIAVDCMFSLGELRRADEALGAMSKRDHDKSDILSEPDRLFRYCRMAHLNSNSSATIWAREELSTYAGLRSLPSQPLAGATPGKQLSALTAWQDSVLQVALNSQEQGVDLGLVETLGPLFQPRVSAISTKPKIKLEQFVTGAGAELGPIYTQLLNEAGEEVEKVLFGDGIPSAMTVAPWYHREKWTSIPRQSLLDRMAVWSVFACNVLLQEKDIDADDMRARNLGAFLLSTNHWMHRYERKTQNSGDIDDIDNWFVLAVKPFVDGVVGGQHEFPHPQMLADVAIHIYNNGFQSEDWPDTIPSEDHRRSTKAKDSVLSAVIVQLANAVASTEYEYRQGRWLDRCAPITAGAVDWFPRQEWVNHISLYSAQCLRALVVQADPCLTKNQRRMLDNVRKNDDWADAVKFNRIILLLPTTDHLPWSSGGVPICDVDDRGLTSALSIAIQRIAAARSDPSTPLDTKRAWYEDFQSVLLKSTNPGDFDRFVQIRIVQLMIDGAFSDSSDEFLIDLHALNLLIFRKLLEFGSNRTFELLRDWLLVGKPIGSRDANLRIGVFEVVFRYLSTLRHLAEADDRPVAIQERARRRARTLVIQQILNCALVNPTPAGPGFSSVSLAEAKKLRRAMLQGIAPRLGLDLPVEYDSFEQPMPFAKDEGFFPATTELVVPDMSTGVLRVVGIGPTSHFGHSLFADAGLNEARYLGLMVGNDEPFVGLALNLKASILGPVPGSLKSGDLVSVENSNARKGAVHSVSVLKRVSALGRLDIYEWPVRMESSPPLGAGRLWVDRTGFGVPFSQEQQTSNYLALFFPKPERWPDYTVTFLIDPETGNVSRRVGQLADLIIDEAENASALRPIILCLKDYERNSNGSLRNITVETMPLREYLLDTRSDIDNSTSETLERLISTYDGIDAVRGLLLVINIVVETVAPSEATAIRTIGPKVALAPDGVVVKPQWSAVQIRAPIDDRNLRWRQIFEESDQDGEEASVLTLGASLMDGTYYLADLPEHRRVEGFPTQVQLNFGTKMLARETLLATVDFNRTGSARDGSLPADEVQTRKIEAEGERLERLLNWLMRGDFPESEMQIGLRFVSKNGVDRLGFINAFSKENLPVQIWAESLTLNPITADPNPDFQRDAIKRKYAAKPKFSSLPGAIPPVVDLTEVPKHAFIDNLATGIIVEVPSDRHGQDAGWRNVNWHGSFDDPPTLLQIENVNDLRSSPQQGWRITLDRTNPRSSKLERMSLMAEALWEVDDRPLQNGLVRSAFGEGSQWHDIQETASGRLAMGDGSQHPNNETQEGDRIHEKYSVSVSTSSMLTVGKFRGDLVRRVALVLKSKGAVSWLSGLVNRRIELKLGPAQLIHIENLIEPTQWKKFVKIRRRFHIQSSVEDALPKFITRSAIKSSNDRTDKGNTEIEVQRREERLASLLAEPFLAGVHDNKTGQFVPKDPLVRKLLGGSVAIVSGEYSLLAPHDPPTAYARYGEARIHLLDVGAPSGSYARASSATLEEFRLELGNPALGSRIRLDTIQLSYVGMDDTEIGRHLLEWGFGWSIALPPSQIRLHGASLHPNQLVLAFGDRITELILEYDQDQVVINITATSLSQEHILYRQSCENIKHLLHISTKQLRGLQDEPKIVKVEGHVGPQQSGSLRAFQRVRPRLGVTSAKEIQKLLLQHLGDASEKDVIVIYGSLDLEAFRNSQGRELVYHAIRIGTEDRGEIRGLKQDDQIFVRAESVREAGNELLLDVKPLSLIVENLVDPQIGKPKRASDGLSIMRRKFSYDESALMRITRDDPDALKGAVLLVRVENVRGNSLTLDHKNVGPKRSRIVLNGLLARHNGAMLCVWTKGTENQVVLEVRPGVLVALPKALIALPHGVKGGLQESDILEIRRADSSTSTSFRAQVAILADRHYARHSRPVVALPTNRLRIDRGDPRNNLKGALESFTVGDFRQLFASIQINDKYLHAEMSRQLTSFMTQPHPKLAWLEPSSRGNNDDTLTLRLSEKERILAGRLSWGHTKDATLPILRVEPHEGCDPSLADLLVDWFDVSCATGTARGLSTQFRQSQWHYHDKKTVTWKVTTDGQIDINTRPLTIGRHTPESGPLFFARVGNVATLRSDGIGLQRRALGFSNLRSELPKSERTKGRLAIVAGTSVSGLFIESTPGRIFDLPWSVLADDDDFPIQFEDLDWQAFGVGDQIWLKREAHLTDPNGQEKIILSWKHGVQNALGPTGAVLPSCETNETEGSVTYGAGQIRIEFPSGSPISLPKTAIIGGRNYLTDADQLLEGSGDDVGSGKSWHWLRDQTVLAVTNDLGQVVVAGLESCFAVPARAYADGTQIDWNKDTLFFDTVRFDQAGSCAPETEEIADLIVAAGGSIAVTVEDVEVSPSGELGTVRFSCRHQLLKTGGIAKAIATGTTMSLGFIIMRVGGRHHKIAATHFVSGAPKELLGLIVEVVRQREHAVWVHVLGSRLRMGISTDKAPREGMKRVRPVAFINEDPKVIAGDAPIAGLVCEDISTRQLHWLPVEALSATPLTRTQAEAVFSGDVSPLDVCETVNGAVSVVGNWPISDELRQLRPGAHLAVYLIARTDSAARTVGEVSRTEWLEAGDGLWIVRSAATNLLMTFRALDAERYSEGHRPIAVEVERRWKQDGMIRIETVPRGTSAARVDLPSDFLSALPPIPDASNSYQVQPVDAKDTGGYGESLNTLPGLDCYYLSSVLDLLIPLLGTNLDTRPEPVSEGIWRLLADLYNRGLRSFHVEPLARRHALKLKGLRAEDENLGVARLIDEIFDLARRPGTYNLAEKIDRLVIFANIYPLTANSRELIYSVAAAFGTRNDLREIWREDGLVFMLVRATRPFLLVREVFSPTEAQSLEDAARACFEDLRHRVQSSGIDVPLLRGFSADE